MRSWAAGAISSGRAIERDAIKLVEREALAVQMWIGFMSLTNSHECGATVNVKVAEMNDLR